MQSYMFPHIGRAEYRSAGLGM